MRLAALGRENRLFAGLLRTGERAATVVRPIDSAKFKDALKNP